MAKPELFKKKDGKIATRKQIATPVTVFLVIFFILAVATTKSDTSNNDNQVQPSSYPSQQQETSIPVFNEFATL